MMLAKASYATNLQVVKELITAIEESDSVIKSDLRLNESPSPLKFKAAHTRQSKSFSKIN
jgi:hypothetical protein